MSLINKPTTSSKFFNTRRIVDINDNPLYRKYTSYQQKLDNKYRENKEKIRESCFNTDTDSCHKINISSKGDCLEFCHIPEKLIGPQR